MAKRRKEKNRRSDSGVKSKIDTEKEGGAFAFSHQFYAGVTDSEYLALGVCIRADPIVVCEVRSNRSDHGNG